MPAFAGPVKGRSLLVKRGTASSEVLIASVRTKSFTANGEAIDITTDDDAGWRKMLEDVSELSVSMSVSGVAKNHTLLAESLVAGDRTQSTVFEYPGGGKMSGLFHLSSYSETGEYQGAVTFDAEFQSSGAVTYTPGA